MGAAQWLSQRLAILVWPRRLRSGLGAFVLPPEIILMVATYLTNPSVISLALTCRTLHTLCFPRSSHLNRAEKEELLVLPEKDMARQYFCHNCTKLYRWHTPWDSFLSTRIEVELPCEKPFERNYLLLPYACYIPYHHARLVMNRHFYGRTHGLPLHKLEDRVRMHSPSTRVTDSESLHARIVDDKLLVLSIKTMSHPRGDSKILRGCIDSLGNPVCKHLTLEGGAPDDVPVQLPELAKDKTTPGRFAPCNQSFGSCPFCLTDYCIDISWNGRKQGYIIRASVYRQLGDCRSPFDWSWRSMTTRETLEEPRTAYPLEYRPGIVRDKWNKADGIDSRTQSKWVEIPELASVIRRNTNNLSSILSI